MGRARVVFLAFCLAALGFAAPAAATTVTVQLSGTWDSVQDDAGLNPKIKIGDAFVATLIYDDQTMDSNPDSAIGDYDVPAASSDLSFSTGSYTFTPASGVGIAIDDDNIFGEDVAFLFAQSYAMIGPPLPPGISIGGVSFINATLTDTSATAHGSDALVALPWSISAYDQTNFFFSTQVFGAGASKFIKLSGTITALAELPEPSAFALVALAGLAIAGRRRPR